MNQAEREQEQREEENDTVFELIALAIMAILVGAGLTILVLDILGLIS